MDKAKYVKFWFELIPHKSNVIERRAGSWVFVAPAQSGKQKPKEILGWKRLEYFPENTNNINPEAADVRFTEQTKKELPEIPEGAPDYALTFYASENFVNFIISINFIIVKVSNCFILE